MTALNGLRHRAPSVIKPNSFRSAHCDHDFSKCGTGFFHRQRAWGLILASRGSRRDTSALTELPLHPVTQDK